MSTTKVSPRCDADQRNSDQGSALSDVHTGADHRRNWISRVAASLFPSHRLLGLRTVWRELCSLPSRIAIARRNNWFRYGICLDSTVRGLPMPHALRRRYRGARIRGIQIMRSIHPEATMVDHQILLTSIDPQIFQEYQDTELGSCENPFPEKFHGREEMEKCKERS